MKEHANKKKRILGPFPAFIKREKKKKKKRLVYIGACSTGFDASTINIIRLLCIGRTGRIVISIDARAINAFLPRSHHPPLSVLLTLSYILYTHGPFSISPSAMGIHTYSSISSK